MSKKLKPSSPNLAQQFEGLTREDLLSAKTLPSDILEGIPGKYYMRVQSALAKGSFCTPGWTLTNAILTVGQYKPKTARGIFDLIQQSVALFGDQGVRGEDLVRFLYNNINMTQQRSPYSEGRPCVPWFEDYISGAVAEDKGFLVAHTPDGELIQKRVKKRVPVASALV